MDTLLEAIEAFRAEDEPDTITSRELRRMTGYGEKKTRETIWLLVEGGKLKPDQIRRVNIHGVSVPTPGYRIVK